MDFDHFGPSRDLLYLSVFLFGCVLGSFLMMIRKTCTLRQRSRWISVILCLVSAALAALTGSVILSQGLIFTASPVYPFLPVFFVLGTAALRFPRAGGCTIIFAAGLFAVWLCISFFVYPRFADGESVQLSIRSAENGELLFRRLIAARDAPKASEAWRQTVEAAAETWNIEHNGRGITFEAVAITAYPGYPIIGGERRGLITQVVRDGEQLLALTKNVYRFRFSGGLGFSLDRYSLELPAAVIIPGINFAVLFDGKKLYFDPPIQL
ncbi:hypothetical protein AGMMS50230_01490 [Spirochaetia bacterium]|nr:hypothetical protein AGMMS50230_01490 [Spirochaetia bacterium]